MSYKIKNKSTKKQTAKISLKKARLFPVLAAAAIVFCAASASGTAEASQENRKAAVIAPGESLVIPTADIAADASFFPVEVDGTAMEVIAVKDSDGNIRTAFNTCRICYDSGRGYYVRSGDFLVCQNCGNRFSTDRIEVESGGCNPWPIFDKNKTITAGGISISYDFLSKTKDIFANWKSGY